MLNQTQSRTKSILILFMSIALWIATFKVIGLMNTYKYIPKPKIIIITINEADLLKWGE